MPEAAPECCLRDRIDLLDQRFGILPFGAQSFAIAATCIRQKAVNFWSDLLDTSALQVEDQLVKLVDILFGQKEIAADLHSCLARELYRVQALSVCTLTQYRSIMDFIRSMESKP